VWRFVKPIAIGQVELEETAVANQRGQGHRGAL
jgi:hypothetical protein